MILPDVNVLIYALREDAPQHVLCRSWLVSVVEGRAAFGLSPLAMSAVVRITTNPRSHSPPTSTEFAFAFCDNLLGQPYCRIVEPGVRHWSIFRQLCAECEIRGTLVTDAWYAALAIERGCEWITMDRDFGRFPGLKWRLPDPAG
jgi:toxin-antitoxin system PIN domain toxin